MNLPSLPPDIMVGDFKPQADLDEITSFIRDTCVAESGRPYFTREELETTMRMPDFEPARDVIVVRDDSGQIAGIEWIQRASPYVRAIANGFVSPERTNEGIGTFLITWVKDRASDLVLLAPEGARIAVSVAIDPNHEPSISLLQDQEMQLHRHFLEMRIDLDDSLADPVFPGGVTLRSVVPGDDDVGIWRAMDDAFRDHFGYVARSEESGVARLRTRMGSDDFDPTLWWMAVDGNEYAGNCWCFGSTEGEASIGYVASLGVRKPWRNRGLAKAMLRHAFTEFRRRGKSGAALHVDAESLTGATKLYESVGMREHDRFATFEWEVRPGESLEIS